MLCYCMKNLSFKGCKSLFFFSVVFEFFFFLERLILFPSVRVRYLLYNKRTR